MWKKLRGIKHDVLKCAAEESGKAPYVPITDEDPNKKI